jgi:hypothetical protein
MLILLNNRHSADESHVYQWFMWWYKLMLLTKLPIFRLVPPCQRREVYPVSSSARALGQRAGCGVAGELEGQLHRSATVE